MKNMIAVLGLLLCAGMANAGSNCLPVSVDTWANPSDDGKGPTEVFALYRHSTGTTWNGTIYPGNPNAGPINAAADTYTFSVEFGADSEGFTTLNGRQGSGCSMSNWSMTMVSGLSVKDLNTGITTNFPQDHVAFDGCNGAACQFDFTDGSHQIALVSGHDYLFYAGIFAEVPNVGDSGNYTYSLRVNVQ